MAGHAGRTQAQAQRGNIGNAGAVALRASRMILVDHGDRVAGWGKPSEGLRRSRVNRSAAIDLNLIRTAAATKRRGDLAIVSAVACDPTWAQ